MSYTTYWDTIYPQAYRAEALPQRLQSNPLRLLRSYPAQ